MAAKSIISTLTASSIQEQINDLGLTRDTAAVHFGFSNGGALGNALSRYHAGVTFAFAKPNGNGGKAPATPVTATPVTANGAMGKPVAPVISGYWQAMSGTFHVPTLDKPLDLAEWFAANQNSPFVAGLDGSIEHQIVDAFCSQFAVTTPAHSKRVEEERAKQQGAIRAAVKAVSADGRFVVGPMGAQDIMLAMESQLSAICCDAVICAPDDVDKTVELISKAKNELARIEAYPAKVIAAMRGTIRAMRDCRANARNTLFVMEHSLQDVIASAANEIRYTAEQSQLIASAMSLGMSTDEAISFLKSKGKL